MRALWCLGLALVALSGCDRAKEARQIKAAEAAIAAQLRDPSSAQFRNVHVPAIGVVCGEVNGKNGFGAYNGFRRFMVVGDAADVEPEQPQEPIEWSPYRVFNDSYTISCLGKAPA